MRLRAWLLWVPSSLLKHLISVAFKWEVYSSIISKCTSYFQHRYVVVFLNIKNKTTTTKKIIWVVQWFSHHFNQRCSPIHPQTTWYNLLRGGYCLKKLVNQWHWEAVYRSHSGREIYWLIDSQTFSKFWITLQDVTKSPLFSWETVNQSGRERNK